MSSETSVASAKKRVSMPSFSLLHREFGNKFLRDPDCVGGREPKVIRNTPDPHTIRNIGVGLNSRQMNFAFACDGNVRGGSFAWGSDLDAEIRKSELELLKGRRRRKFGESNKCIAVEDGRL